MINIISNLQDTGTKTLLRLIAVNVELLAYLRTVIVDKMFCSVEGHISVGYQPFFVTVAKNIIESTV